MLQLDDVAVHFDGEPAIAGVDLEIPDGEVLAVVGPSGCGKSTLLRAVAGLEPLAAGAVTWDGADQAGVATHRRGFALMFQDGQLFDHLDVTGNVEYALRRQGKRRRDAAPRVAELLDLVGLGGYADRMPRTLSGGERQRVALARSLAADPKLVLLDEPLTALDAELRNRLAADLRRILTAAGSTALFVTHDQAEAYAVADRVAVMREGRVVQQGTVGEVWSTPVDAETARFLGYSSVLEGAAAARLLAAAGLGKLDHRASVVEPAPPVVEPAAPVVEPAAPVVEPASPVVEPVPPVVEPVPPVVELAETQVAVRRSALEATREATELTAEVCSVVPTPDALHLTVMIDGVGELAAYGPPAWLPAVGDRVGIEIHPDRLAVLGEST